MGSNSSASDSIIIPNWASELPKEWSWHQLDEVSLEIIDCPHSTPKVVDGGPYLMARTSDVLGGVFRTHEARRVSEADYRERIRRAEPRFGDLLYSREGTYFGIAAEVPPDTKVCLGQRMVLLRPDPCQVEARFLRHWLNSPGIQSFIHGHRDGSVAERLNLPTIRRLPICTPALHEQRAIAHILGTLDDKIELNRRMNETLEAMARALFKSWFVDFDHVRAKAEGRDTGLPRPIADLFPDSFEDSELGKIPKGWKVSTVGQHFDLTMGQSPPGITYNETGEGLPFYQGRRDFRVRFPSRRVFCTAPRRLAEPGDSLVSVRAPVGDVNMANERCAVGRGVAAVRHHSGGRSYTYYSMHELGDNFRTFEGEGTVFGSINKKDFEGLFFVAPSPETLDAFDRIVSPLDDRIESNEGQAYFLTALRDTLLPKLISGELHIEDAERFLRTVDA